MQFLGYFEAGFEGLDIALANRGFLYAQVLAQKTLVERAKDFASVPAAEFHLLAVLQDKHPQETVQVVHGLLVRCTEIQKDATVRNTERRV